MATPLTTATQTGLPYVCSVAHALTEYADAHPSFAKWLTAATIKLEPVNTPPAHHLPLSPVLIPQDDAAAMRRTYWLIDQCTHNRPQGHKGALAVLASWTHIREREDPKAVILGFDVGWWPIGVMGHQKKHRQPMDIILRTDIMNTSPLALTRTLTALTHRVVEQGLIMANGHTGKLEPELGDWLFGDKHLALYTAHRKDLNEFHHEIARTGAPYAHEHDEQGTTLLALSPALFCDLPNSPSVTPVDE